MIAVSRANGNVLVHDFADGERLQLWWVNADDGQRACFCDRLNSPLECLGRSTAYPPVLRSLLRVRTVCFHFGLELLFAFAIGMSRRRIHPDRINNAVRTGTKR